MVHGFFVSSLIFISSLLFLYIAYKILKKISGDIKIPFISTFFILKYIIFAYIGSFLLNVFYFAYTIPLNERPDLLLYMWIYAVLGLFLLLLGMYVANISVNYSPLESTKKLLSTNIQFTQAETSNTIFYLIIFMVLISFAVLILYISKLDTLPIFAVFQGYSPTEIIVLRSQATNAFDGKYYRYMMFIRDLPLFLILIVFFLKDYSRKWKYLFIILLFYNVFVNIMDTQKAPLLQLFMLLMLSYFYVKNEVSKKVFIITGVLLSFGLLLMYKYFMGSGHDLYDTIAPPLNRIFLGQIKPFYYWQLFQEEYGYIFGASLPNPAHIFPFEFRNIPIEVMNYVHPEVVAGGRIGTMPTVYYADWFINFGPLAALFSSFLLGYILQIADIYFISKLNKKKTIFLSALFIYIVNYFGKFSGTTYLGIIFDTHLVFPIVIYLIMIKFKRIKK